MLSWRVLKELQWGKLLAIPVLAIVCWQLFLLYYNYLWLEYMILLTAFWWYFYKLLRKVTGKGFSARVPWSAWQTVLEADISLRFSCCTCPHLRSPFLRGCRINGSRNSCAFFLMTASHSINLCFYFLCGNLISVLKTPCWSNTAFSQHLLCFVGT